MSSNAVVSDDEQPEDQRPEQAASETRSTQRRRRRLIGVLDSVLFGCFLLAALIAYSLGSAYWTYGADSYAAPLSSVLYGVVALVAGASITLWKVQLRRALDLTEREDPGETLRRRIDEVDRAFRDATSAFRRATALVDDLRNELAVQQAARDEAIAQAEEHRRVLEIEPDRAEQIRAILGRVGEKRERKGRRLNVVFLLLGIPMGILVNLVTPWLQFLIN
jgi:hypothetical protein